MNMLLSLYRRISDDYFNELRETNAVMQIGPFELITSPAKSAQYGEMLSALWEPIEYDYIGKLISRYLQGVVAGIEGQPFWGRHGIDPYIIIRSPVGSAGLPNLCRYFLRRAIYLRQISLGVHRTSFTSRTIAKRTTNFVFQSHMGMRIISLYKNAAEQTGGGNSAALRASP